jgi:hypothetical protein
VRRGEAYAWLARGEPQSERGGTAIGMPNEDGFRRDRDPRIRRNARRFGLAAPLLIALIIVGVWVSRTSTPARQPAAARPTTPPTAPCGGGSLQLHGAFNDCARAVSSAPLACSVSGDSLNVVIRLHGSQHDYLLEIAIAAQSPPEPLTGVYGLQEVGRADIGGPRVAIREFASGAYWQATAGSLSVLDSSPSGFVVADLTYQGGAPTPASNLKISGAWSCT